MFFLQVRFSCHLALQDKSILMIISKMKEEGKEVPFHDYQSSGTDDRRKHLAKHHLKPWIECCVASNIPLTSVAAKKALQEYRNKYVVEGSAEFNPSTEDVPPTPFSQEAMVDAIMYHIIADDEVSTIPYVWMPSLIIL